MLKKTTHADIVVITSSSPVLGRVLFASKTYRVGSLLIDAGIFAGPEFLSLAGNASALCITHPHPDHIGYASLVQERWGIPVYASSEALAVLASPLVPPLPIRLAIPAPVPCIGMECPHTITGGGTTLVPLLMPGHTRGHLCFYDEDNARAFTGDLLLWGTSSWVGVDVEMERAIDSLERLAALGLDYAYPGHGKPIRHPSTVIEGKVGRMRAFGKKVYALHKRGLSEREIQIRLLGHEGWMYIFSHGYFSKRNLIRSYLKSVV